MASMLSAVLSGLLLLAVGGFLVRWPAKAERSMTSWSASPRVMGWTFLVIGTAIVLSGSLVEQE